MKGRKLIGIGIIIIGLGIFSYPIIRQAYSAHRQKDLKIAFEEILETNQKVSNPSETIAPSIAPSDSVSAETDTSYIDLEEADEVPDTQNADNIKDRLRGQTVIGLIEIEKLDLIYAIVEGTSDHNLGVAIGHMTSTVNLGEVGNCALAGHRGGTSGPYFKNIDKLVAGDEIKVTDVYGKETIYKVTESFLVEATEMWVADNNTDQKMLTLITCEDDIRLIVRAISE